MANFRNVPTPWGRSTGGCRMAEGIVSYHTPGHGGVKAVKRLNDRIPAGFRAEDGWHEEDCEAMIPFYFFHEEIEAYMTATGMQGFSVTAEEYFGRFTKEYLRDYLESSGHWIPACVYHFGTVYSDERLEEYGRERLAAELERIRRKESRVLPKKGDTVMFSEPVRFKGGHAESAFVFEARNLFRTPDGRLASIRNWKSMDFDTVRRSG
jgi:hypothetical protein